MSESHILNQCGTTSNPVILGMDYAIGSDRSVFAKYYVADKLYKDVPYSSRELANGYTEFNYRYDPSSVKSVSIWSSKDSVNATNQGKHNRKRVSRAKNKQAALSRRINRR